MTDLLKFELTFFIKRPATYIIAAALFVMGFFIGYKLSITPGADILRNSPYSVANMIGFLSLLGIFIATFFAAQTLLQENDSRFNVILFATPITKIHYLSSRFAAVFLMSLGCLVLLIAGFGAGQLADPDQASYGPFAGWFYIQPFLIIALPNLFFCLVLVSGVTWLSRNKLMTYISGLGIYIVYMVLLMYSGSPMMSRGLPQSPEVLEFSAKTDPFGLSAFYQQTNSVTLMQKNTQMIHLKGNLLINRIFYCLLSVALLFLTCAKMRLSIKEKSGKKRTVKKETGVIHRAFQPVLTLPSGLVYQMNALRSYTLMNVKMVMKGLPFALIATILIFYLSMEFYGSIDQGIRLPEQYASTTLIINRILYNLPGILILIALFFSQELYWRTSTYRFDSIENSTAAGKIIPLLSHWISLAVLVFVLTTMISVNGVVFQLIYHYPKIEWLDYVKLYWLVDAPLVTAIGLTLSIQKIINHKWAGLAVSGFLILLVATSLGKSAGITHPLVRLASGYGAMCSGMNGWDDYPRAFSWRIFYGLSCAAVLFLAVSQIKKWKSGRYPVMLAAILLTCCLSSGIYIAAHLPSYTENEKLDRQQRYEEQYRQFQHLPQPTVTDIKTYIDLYTEKNSYHVRGHYKLQNKTSEPVNSLLLYFSEEINVDQAIFKSAKEQIFPDGKSGVVTLKTPLLPNDTASMDFTFTYHWDGFTGHQSFNAIVQNGTFIRLSNYFPGFGYNADAEITDRAERRKRNLGETTPLTLLEAPRAETTDFIHLDMIVSTAPDQTAVGTGELTHHWKTNGRAYFQYETPSPVPFRFAVSSAVYQIRKMLHRGIDIEVLYDAKHAENVDHLMASAEKSLDYCQTNFGIYPFKTIRFAEVSSFTRGFAGTAYPGTIFMTEDMIFHANLQGDRGQDVINELAGHELSHQWWGTNQLVPDEREGSGILTETLAMYTELMMVKHTIGSKALHEKVEMHYDMYMNEKGFAKEEPLYKVKPESTHLFYSKGLVAMYKLSELIGEENINKALKSVLEKHAYPNPRPVSTDFLEELYHVSKPSSHSGIDELFKQVVPITDLK